MRKLQVGCLLFAGIIASLICYIYFEDHCQAYAIDVQMKVTSSSDSSISQIFFSPNQQFKQTMSDSKLILSDKTYHHLFFRLSGDPVKTIRFDFLNTPGTAFIKSLSVKTYGGKPIKNLMNSALISTSQIKEIQRGKSVFSITTIEKANDPFIEIETNLPDISDYFFSSFVSSLDILTPIFLKFFFLFFVILEAILYITNTRC